jgi:membrane associated rhomboid family serine protease
MAGRFSYSSPESRYGGTPWFKVGDVDVGTAVLVAGACVLSMFVWAIDRALLEPLVLIADDVRGGQIWRLVTWPFANAPDFWTIITIAIFWYFGRELEGLLGRNRFAWFLAILTVVPAVIGALVGFNVAGLEYLELGVFIVFIAEHPTARFFFNIPGWVIGAVIVGLQFLQLAGDRNGDGLVFLLVLLATAGLAARSFGLATQLPWIPKLPMPGAGSGRGSAPKRRRSGGTATKARSRQTVVEGPWASPGSTLPSPDAAAAQAELDVLLDKISAGGLDSLTSDEKRRLNDLSKRLR